MSVVGGLPGAPAVAGTVPGVSPQAAREGGQALVLGPAGDGGALSLWDPADRATPLSVRAFLVRAVCEPEVRGCGEDEVQVSDAP